MKNGAQAITADLNRVNLEPIERSMSRTSSTKLRDERCKTAFKAAFHNFQTARKMAQDNLDHQPLPDAVLDKKFNELQAQGDLHPGLSLGCKPIATGIGYKGYKVGPTQCTKLKVYRPKTCGVIPKHLDKSTMDDFEDGNRLKLDPKIGPMDLAIRWDYRPKGRGREPKLPRHIDGSNDIVGSIFTKVQQSKEKEEIAQFERAEGVFHNTQGEVDFFDRDLILKRKDHQNKYEKGRDCTCGTDVASFKNVPGSESVTSKNRPKTTKSDSILYSSSANHRRCKSSPNLSMIALPRSTTEPGSITTQFEEEKRKLPVTQLPKETDLQRRVVRQPRFAHQTIPKLCEQMRHDYENMMKKYFLTQELIKMDENNNYPSIVEPTKVIPKSKTPLIHVPRPKQPYKKRNYHIDSLAPPFSSWTGTGQEYPNHWRLASIYQHAYKPVESRKRPFLQSIYR